MSFLLARMSHVVGQLITGRAFAAFAPFEVEDTEGRAVTADVVLAEGEAAFEVSAPRYDVEAFLRATAAATGVDPDLVVDHVKSRHTPQFPPVGAGSPVPPAGDGSVPASAVAGTDQPLCGDLFGRYGCNRPPGHVGPHELAHLHGCVIKRWAREVVELDAPGCVHVGKNTTS